MRIASQKKAAQATSTNQLSTDRPFVSIDRPFVSTDRSNTPNVSAASTSIGANANESSFVYLGGKIPIDASTLPNSNLPIDLNMPDLEDASDTLLNDGIFNGAYDDDEDVGVVADFNNMDNTIAVSPIPTLRIHKDHLKGQILGDPTSAVQTKGKIQKASSAQQALDESWVKAMQEELLQFKLQQVWILMDLPFGKKAIGTKWVFRNKRDERSIVVKNKAKLAAQEEAYVHQPLGFVDPVHPNKVYKVVKALYSLHQAPRAWYETLSSFLLENGFRRGTIDKTLFIKKNKSDIMLVKVYVDDIIFGSTKKSMCTEFEEVMHKRFQMSSMGELTFFLGLQVKQQPDGIFISQDKKSTTGGMSFLGRRLISWQYKKQTIMANSTTKAEYVAAAHCCGQNPVYQSRTKHIEIRHHFIRDCYEKKLIDVLKIHTDSNVEDLLTKGFDVTRFYLRASRSQVGGYLITSNI
ncbi:putative ribonuclease H-like domain-containing protein [Tanacetum coccineum]